MVVPQRLLPAQQQETSGRRGACNLTGSDSYDVQCPFLSQNRAGCARPSGQTRLARHGKESCSSFVWSCVSIWSSALLLEMDRSLHCFQAGNCKQRLTGSSGGSALISWLGYQA